MTIARFYFCFCVISGKLVATHWDITMMQLLLLLLAGLLTGKKLTTNKCKCLRGVTFYGS